MRALIAIQSIPNERFGRSSHSVAELAMLETWLKGLPSWCAFQFFYPETYEGHFKSIQTACKDAVKDNYDYLFVCDRDTYCRPERFLPSRFDHHDYTGYPLVNGDWPFYYASGGAGYWMSKRAFSVIAEAEKQPNYHADLSVGILLKMKHILLWPDPRYFLFRVPIEPHNTHISMHLSKGQGNYKPEWMREVHEEFESL